MENVIHNERVKLFANTVNMLGLAFVVAAFVDPVVGEKQPVPWTDVGFWLWIYIGLMLHLTALRCCGKLVQETQP